MTKVEDGVNRTEFEIALSGVAQFFFALYDQEMIDDIAEAMIQEYTDWPYRHDVIKNRDNLMAVSKQNSIYIIIVWCKIKLFCSISIIN